MQWGKQFQSSPGHATGRDTPGPRNATASTGFNPHPATRPGATACRECCCRCNPGLGVSILTRPRDRARRPQVSLLNGSIRTTLFQSSPGHATGRDADAWHKQLTGDLVSILTRPRDRTRQCLTVRLFTSRMFQSSPGHATGRDARRECCCRSYSPPVSFNPHPATRPGATPKCHPNVYPYAVSILTRPRDRARHRVLAACVPT